MDGYGCGCEISRHRKTSTYCTVPVLKRDLTWRMPRQTTQKAQKQARSTARRCRVESSARHSSPPPRAPSFRSRPMYRTVPYRTGTVRYKYRYRSILRALLVSDKKTMKLKHLESALSSVNYKFDDPRVEYEQYPTSPHLAASVALAAFERGDLGEHVSVADLGCGTGMLSIACACLGCSQVIGVDLDGNAIRQAKENVREMELEHVVDFIQAELKYIPSSTSSSDGPTKYGKPKHRQKNSQRRHLLSRENLGSAGMANGIEEFDDGIPLRSKCVDTVLINPPFGTKHNAGIDVGFLAAGCRLARKAVYSFHKTSTRDFLLKKARNEWNMQCEVIAEMKFDIPQTYNFHKKKCVDIEVDLLRLVHIDAESTKKHCDEYENQEADHDDSDTSENHNDQHDDNDTSEEEDCDVTHYLSVERVRGNGKDI